jgi:hypothetical protein
MVLLGLLKLLITLLVLSFLVFGLLKEQHFVIQFIKIYPLVDQP